MPADLNTAIDDINGAFNVVWLTDTPAVVGTAPPVQWPKVPFEIPDPPTPWARVVIQHNTGSQAVLSDVAGSKRWTRTGAVIVSIFTPLADGKGLDIPAQLATIAKKAFEGKTTANGVWFRDVVPREIGESGAWYQWNVLAEFRYDEFI